MKNNIYKNDRGFTLIEVIVSLVVAAILGAMLVTFMWSGVIQSANPVILAQNGAYLNSIMEKMSSDYRYQMATALAGGSTPAQGYALFNDSSFGAEGASSYKYSDESHPYTVVTNHTITFSNTPPYTEAADSSEIHKVTIEYRGLRATAIFTE